MVVCKPVKGVCRSVWFSGMLTGTCRLMGMVDWTGMDMLRAIGKLVPAGSVTLASELMASPPVLMTTCALGMLTLLVNTTVVFCDTGRLKLSGIWASTAMVVFILAWSILTIDVGLGDPAINTFAGVLKSGKIAGVNASTTKIDYSGDGTVADVHAAIPGGPNDLANWDLARSFRTSVVPT